MLCAPVSRLVVRCSSGCAAPQREALGSRAVALPTCAAQVPYLSDRRDRSVPVVWQAPHLPQRELWGGVGVPTHLNSILNLRQVQLCFLLFLLVTELSLCELSLSRV